MLFLALAGLVSSCDFTNRRPSNFGNTRLEVKRPRWNHKGRKRSVREGKKAVRDLLSERNRMEEDVKGAFIDLGSPADTKHTRGGWWTGFSHVKQTDEVARYSQVKITRARLGFFLARSKADRVAIRARSPGEEVEMTVYLDGRELAEIPLEARWTTHRLRVPHPLLDRGNHVLRFRFSRPRGTDVRAEIDWVWVGEGRLQRPPSSTTVAPTRLGGTVRRALCAPTPRTLAYYFHVPQKAFLVFDYATLKEDAEFVVRVATDKGGTVELFRKTARPGRWNEGQVDLSPFSHQPVRLELGVVGSSHATPTPGKSRFYWGEPEVVVHDSRALKAPSARKGLQAQGPAPSPPLAPSKPPKNVVLVVIDTARADAFSSFEDDTPVKTPAHDALAKKSTIFTRAYNNENWTTPSVATILTGLYPSTHGAQNDDDALSEEHELISERLKSSGFQTAAFIANGFCSEPFGFKQGWDRFRNYIRESRPHEAEDVFKEAAKWIKKRKDKRFFAYIQTIDPHVPYTVERKYTRPYFSGRYAGHLGGSISGTEQVDISKGRTSVSRRDLRWLKSLYWGEITYHDKKIGAFVQTLEKEGILDDTLLIVTNDHGEELLEHGALGHGHTLYEELLKAPLLVYYPPLFPKNKSIDTIVEGVDIAPTILDALGLKPSKDMAGRSLLPLARGVEPARPSYAMISFLEYKRAILIGDLKLMISSGRWEKFFHLGEDPGEKRDLRESRPVSRRLCEVYLSEGLGTPHKRKRLLRRLLLQKKKGPKTKAKIDKKLKKRLEAVGYF